MVHGPVVVERVTTARGELVLRRSDDDYEVISNGTFLMDTRDGRSERLLVRAALAAHADPGSVLVGGLGVGFSLLEALADDRVREVTIVEIESVLLDWHATYLSAVTGAAMVDPRTTVVVDDLVAHLDGDDTSYDVICLDVDNGPGWTVTDSNTRLYDDAGTTGLVRRLRPGGVLAVWSAHQAPAYERLLRRHLADVRSLRVEVDRGEPDVVYLGTAAGA